MKRLNKFVPKEGSLTYFDTKQSLERSMNSDSIQNKFTLM